MYYSDIKAVRFQSKALTKVTCHMSNISNQIHLLI